MASPHVAGVAAMIESLGVTRDEAVREALFESARAPAGGGDKQLYGAGILDARRRRLARVLEALRRSSSGPRRPRVARPASRRQTRGHLHPVDRRLRRGMLRGSRPSPVRAARRAPDAYRKAARHRGAGDAPARRVGRHRLRRRDAPMAAAGERAALHRSLGHRFREPSLAAADRRGRARDRRLCCRRWRGRPTWPSSVGRFWPVRGSSATPWSASGSPGSRSTQSGPDSFDRGALGQRAVE